MVKLNVNKVTKAIEGSYGVLMTVARRCGVTRRAIVMFLEKNPDLKELVIQEGERIIDESEETIHEIATMTSTDPKVLGHKLKAAEKVVSSKGAKRGWATRQEIETTSNELKKVNTNLLKLKNLTKEQEKIVREALYGDV